MYEIGQFTDSRGVTITVLTCGKRTYIKVTGYPGDTNPSPHLTAGQADLLVGLLREAHNEITGSQRTRWDNGQPVPLSRTERGFTNFGVEFTDMNGNEILVRESSAVGEPKCYLFIDDPTVPEEVKYKLPWSENTYKDPDHHLNTSQTRLLSNSLEAFVKDAARPDNWRNSEGYIANWRADEKGTEEAPDACSDPT